MEMTDREKLIELMCEAKKADTEDAPFSEFLADFLIANGVTFAKDNNVPGKWIPVTERLPEESGNYIVTACDEGCPYGEGIWYDTVVVVAEYYHGSWTWNENGTEYDLCSLVTHWMPLPEPPREGI